MEKQAVVEQTDAQETPATEADDAQDLETILAEYQNDSGQDSREESDDQETDSPNVAAELKELRARMERREREEIQAKVQEDIGKSVSRIKDSLKDNAITVSDRIVRGVLNELAQEDPRILRAFNERYKNPQGWERVEAGIAKSLVSEFGIDKSATESVNAVKSHVRGSQPTREDEPRWESMSDSEFERMKRQIR